MSKPQGPNMDFSASTSFTSAPCPSSPLTRMFCACVSVCVWGGVHVGWIGSRSKHKQGFDSTHHNTQYRRTRVHEALLLELVAPLQPAHRPADGLALLRLLPRAAHRVGIPRLVVVAPQQPLQRVGQVRLGDEGGRVVERVGQLCGGGDWVIIGLLDEPTFLNK